jgi:hypothetical protein
MNYVQSLTFFSSSSCPPQTEDLIIPPSEQRSNKQETLPRVCSTVLDAQDVARRPEKYFKFTFTERDALGELSTQRCETLLGNAVPAVLLVTRNGRFSRTSSHPSFSFHSGLVTLVS